MVAALYIIHWPYWDLQFHDGQLLLHRRYHNNLPTNSHILHTFDEAYRKLPPAESVPILYHKGISFVYFRGDNDILLVAVTMKNINAMLTVVFLNNFYKTLRHYIENASRENPDKPIVQLDRDTIVDNLNLVFDLLDECMDFGIVQLTDYNLLKEYIKVKANLPKLKGDHEFESLSEEEESPEPQAGGKSKKKKKKKSKKKNEKITSTHNHAITTDQIAQDMSVINSSILRTYALAINWRSKGIFYAKNEIYIDLVEDCEFYYDLEKDVIKKNEIQGTCAVKCYLSGMPVCKLGFNESQISGIENDSYLEDLPENQLKQEVEDDEDEEEKTLDSKKHSKIPIRNIQFHQCIELGSVYKENLVTFTPPDDKFILMTYNVEQQKQKRKLPLIMIKPTYRILKESKKIQVLCILSTNYKRRLHCRDLVVRLPINPHVFNIATELNDDNALKYKAEMGEVNFKLDTSEIIWTLDNVTGKKSIRMMAELTLQSCDELELAQLESLLHNRVGEPEQESESSDEDDEIGELDRYYGVNGQSSSLAQLILKAAKLKRNFNDISVSFTIPMLTYSGLKLNYLRVDEEKLKYTCFPWIRYVTESRNNKETGALDIKDFQKRNCSYRFKLGILCFDMV